MKVSLSKLHFCDGHTRRNVSFSKRSVPGKVIMWGQHVDNVNKFIIHVIHWVKKTSSP